MEKERELLIQRLHAEACEIENDASAVAAYALTVAMLMDWPSHDANGAPMRDTFACGVEGSFANAYAACGLFFGKSKFQEAMERLREDVGRYEQ